MSRDDNRTLARAILQAFEELQTRHSRFTWNHDDQINIIRAHTVRKIRRRFYENYSKRQLSAILAYTGPTSNYKAINSQLRSTNGYQQLSDSISIPWLQSDRASLKSTIDDLDTVVNSSRLDRDMTLYRGVPFDIVKHQIATLQPGDHLNDQGYMSTTMNKQHATYFAGSNNLMIIHAHRGDTAFPVPQALAGGTSTGKPEEEVIFPRDTVLRFDGKKHGEYYFEVVE